MFFASCTTNSERDNNSTNSMENKNISKSQFKFFDIDFDSSVLIRKHLTDGNYSSWIVENRSGKIAIETIRNNDESSSKGSISIYDNYLSTSVSERNQYSILQKFIHGTSFRLVERSHSRDTNFIELYANNLCSDHSQLLITGVDISKKDTEWLKECFQSIRIKCDD